MAAGFMAGAVVGKLMLDKTQWSNSVKSVKDDETKLKGMSTRTAGNFRKMGTAMAVAGVAVVAGLGAMINKYVEAGDEIGKMAARTGMATTTLSELKYAADITGASFSDIEKATKKMGKTISDAGDGMATYVRSFEKLGISVEEVSKLGIEEQFFAIGEAISNIEEPFARSAAAQEIFGRAGTTLLPLFDQGEAGLQKLREEAHKLGIIFEDTSGAERLKDKQGDLNKAFQGLSFTLAEHLVPALTDIAIKITGVITNVTAWAKAHPGLFNAITKAVGVVGGLLAVMGPMVILIPKMVLGIKGIGLAMKAALGPIGLAVAALAAAGAVMNAWINARKKAMDIEMDAMVADKTLGNTLLLRRKLIEDNIMTQEEWTTLVNKHGRDYKAVMNAINTDPALANVKTALDEIIPAQEDVGDGTEDLGTDYSNLMDQITGTNEVAKTWTDYLKDNAILTIKEKSDKVEELEGFLGNLDTAYIDGKLSLEDYNAAQEIAHDELVELGAASKTYYDHLEELGIPTIEAQNEQIDTTKERLDALNKSYADGVIDELNYEKGIKIIEAALEDVNPDFIVVDGMVQQLGVHFDAFVPKAHTYGGALADMMGPPKEATKEFEVQTFTTSKEVETLWSGVADGLKTKWAGMFGEFVKSGDIFKGDFKGLVGSIKTMFSDLVGSMATKWMLGFVDKLISGSAGIGDSIRENIAGALAPGAADMTDGVSSLTGAIGGLANPVNMISGAITAIASVITALQGPGGPSSTDSWHFAETWKESKQLTDYTMAEIGSSGGWLSRIHAVGYVIVGKIEYTMRQNRKSIGILGDIEKNTGDTVSALKNLPKAQTGYKSTQSELVQLHGTPEAPEYVVPHNDMSRLMNAAPAAPAAVYNVNVANTVTIPGLMVTDRDYTRERIIPEFLAALRAQLGKADLKEILGLT